VTHRLLGAATALAVARWAPGLGPVHGLTDAATLTAAAVLCAGGRTSPDVDNSRLAKTVDRWLPDELLGHGGPLGHRRLAHWWALPVLAWLVIPAGLPDVVLLGVHGAVLGWASHIVGDLVFGRGNPMVGLPRGVPVLPWWGHVGVGLKADGLVERAVSYALVPACAWLAIW
jgi:hypothetical protein